MLVHALLENRQNVVQNRRVRDHQGAAVLGLHHPEAAGVRLEQFKHRRQRVPDGRWLVAHQGQRQIEPRHHHRVVRAAQLKGAAKLAQRRLVTFQLQQSHAVLRVDFAVLRCPLKQAAVLFKRLVRLAEAIVGTGDLHQLLHRLVGASRPAQNLGQARAGVEGVGREFDQAVVDINRLLRLAAHAQRINEQLVLGQGFLRATLTLVNFAHPQVDRQIVDVQPDRLVAGIKGSLDQALVKIFATQRNPIRHIFAQAGCVEGCDGRKPLHIRNGHAFEQNLRLGDQGLQPCTAKMARGGQLFAPQEIRDRANLAPHLRGMGVFFERLRILFGCNQWARTHCPQLGEHIAIRQLFRAPFELSGPLTAPALTFKEPRQRAVKRGSVSNIADLFVDRRRVFVHLNQIVRLTLAD